MVCFASKLLLLAYSLQTVTSAPESVFVREGNSVTLAIKGFYSLNPNHIFWLINRTHEVVRYYSHHPKSRRLRVSSFYKGRVEFNSSTFSLEVKNMQKNDSGLYRAEISAPEGVTFTEYRLVVLEAAEQVIPPMLTVVSNWSSSDSCYVNLTCRGQNHSVTFTCNSSICSVVEGATDPTLTVFIKAGGAQDANYMSFAAWIRITIGVLIVVGSSAVLCYWFAPQTTQNPLPDDKMESPHTSTQPADKTVCSHRKDCMS